MISTVTLENGTGASIAAKVNASNQLETYAVGVSAMHDATLRGDAFSWTAVTENLAALGTALCVVNQSTTRKLIISSVYTYSDVPSLHKIHCPAPVTWAGTATVGVNLNREKSATLADAVAYGNESANAFAAANTILTLASNELTTDQYGIMVDLLLGGALILEYDDAIAVDIVADSAAFTCTISGYFID